MQGLFQGGHPLTIGFSHFGFAFAPLEVGDYKAFAPS